MQASWKNFFDASAIQQIAKLIAGREYTIRVSCPSHDDHFALTCGDRSLPNLTVRCHGSPPKQRVTVFDSCSPHHQDLDFTL